MKFADMYPKDRFYAAEFQGRPVTLTFRAKDPVTSELLGKGSASEKTLPIWHFDETPKKLPAVVTNGVCARAIMQTVLGKVEGDESENWGGHKITLYPAPDPSGLADDGLCIRVKGSPELERNLVFNAQIGRQKKTFTLVPTGNGNAPAAAPAAVDPVTGEVAADGNANEAAEDTRAGQGGDAGLFAAPTTPATENGADEDGEAPGRGPLVKTTDPVTPARQHLLDVAWDKAINEGADEGELLAAVCDAVGAPTLEGLTMGQAAAGLQYLQAQP